MPSVGSHPGTPAGIEIRGWGWRHASRKAWALADVDLVIDPGERVLLLGASGSGKSTLLHGIAGVLGGDEEGEATGTLLVGGAPPTSARGRVGLVLQDPDSQVILARVGDDVAFGCENLGVPRDEIWPRVGEALDAVGLDVPLDRPTKALSGGQKQRLALAAEGVWVPGIAPAVPGPPRIAPGEVLLEAAGLAVSRVRGESVASGLTLDVRAGEALAVTGPNGAGKSTLGLTLAGLLRPAGGTVAASAALADGAASAPIAWTSKQLLTRIGTVFQEPEHQLLTRSVREELEVGPRALGLPQAQTHARVDELLERLRLSALARANPYTLSGGEKRRLTVAAALATAPRVLVLDEPTFGQDARTWAELVALLARLRDDGNALVVITHDARVVSALHARTFALTGARS